MTFKNNIYISNYVIIVAFFCLSFLGATNCFAQEYIVDSLSNKITKYGAKQAPAMFVHFDKTIYSNNENVWFTAYLLNAQMEEKHTVLLVNLVKDDSREVVLEDKFVMEKGLAFGNIFLPDSVTAGNYTLVAFTNVLVDNKPLVIFKQPITVKTANLQTFSALLTPLDTAAKSAERKVMLMANKFGAGVLPNAQVSYYVGSPANHLLSGRGKTDATGQYIFNIPSKILSEGNNKLYVSIKHNKEEREISMSLPVESQAGVVNFYPEGGNLVNNLQSYIGWEAKTASGTSLKTRAVLYKDNNAIDTIETDGYGMGKFFIKPQATSKYYVKLLKSDIKYALPTIISAGPVIYTSQALVNDTLSVTLFDNKPEKLYLLIHNYKELFSAMPIVMNGAGKRVKVVLAEVPKGLAQITITDSLGRPFAQRTFFAHHDRKTSLQVNTDRPEYTIRKKVSIKLKLNEQADTSAMALVSIAAVQDNRLEIKKQNNIESYFYLKNDLGDMPLKENYLTNNDADKQFLENILLIKAWTRYKWTDVLKAKMHDSLKFETPAFKGKITTLTDKPLKKPVELILKTDRSVIPLKTDSTGNVVFENADLVTAPDKKILAMVSGDKADLYKVKVTDPYTTTAQKIPTLISYQDFSTVAQQSTSGFELADNQKSTILKEVVIRDKKTDDQFFGLAGKFGANECGDYVCRFNNLNCPNHRGESDNTKPVAGKMYNGVFYTGCIVPPKVADISAKFKGIYSAVEFYGSDYSEVSLSQPDYVSTIFWKHLVPVKANKETEFSFYTSDITGRFKIIVQGITNNDVVYSEKTFNVVKPK